MKSQIYVKYFIKDMNKDRMKYSEGQIFDQDAPYNHIDYCIVDTTQLRIQQLCAEDSATLFCLLGLIIRFGQNNGIRRIEIEKSLDDNVIDTLTALGFTEKDNNNVRKRLFVFDIPESEYFVIR